MFWGRRPQVTPIAEGVSLAVVAAVLFGITTPVIKGAGTDAGPFATAMLLYAGAALASIPWSKSSARREAPMRRGHVGRLVAIALLGGVIAPACFAWGVQHTSGTSAALLLNFEAVFTVLLGWRLYGEGIAGRVVVAVFLMMLGGAVIVMTSTAASAGIVGWGVVAVVLATLGWALDNALTRPLADLDPVQVVRWKGALGALLCVLISIVLGEAFPKRSHVVALLICGAAGYGMSLRLYLLAQRKMGAGRTGSVFALAPFIGAAVAWGLGERANGFSTLGAGLLFGLAVYLHATETHEHRHIHEPVEHEHAHRHDDGHHDHSHDPEIAGTHSHFHVHEERMHEHAHGPYVHHGHRHTSSS
jgi:drug/metabolite transporter (DMT)-like permease